MMLLKTSRSGDSDLIYFMGKVQERTSSPDLKAELHTEQRLPFSMMSLFLRRLHDLKRVLTIHISQPMSCCVKSHQAVPLSAPLIFHPALIKSTTITTQMTLQSIQGCM